jgi:hypothetical protein
LDRSGAAGDDWTAIAAGLYIRVYYCNHDSFPGRIDLTEKLIHVRVV